MSIKIALADDQALFRKGVKAILEQEEDLEVIHEASDGLELIDKIRKKKPDVVLLDIQMPRMDGIQTLDRIRQDFPSIRTIMLSFLEDDTFVAHLMENGANGYLVKDTEPEELLRAIRTVVSEDYYYGNFLTKVMHRRMIERTRIQKRPTLTNPTHLSDREIEILKLICQGSTNAEIGSNLCISERTVEGHRTRMMDKIGAKNVAAMVVFAVKNKIY